MSLPRLCPIRLTVALIAFGLLPSLHAAEAPAGKFTPTAQEQYVPAGAKLEALWTEGEFTEGPAPAADGTILFSDIGDWIWRYDPASGRTTMFRNPSGKSNGLMFDPAGRLVACEGAGPGGNRRISITDASGEVRALADRWMGKRFNSPNDLAITSKGRVYFSDPRYVGTEPREIDFEGVFLVEPDGTVQVATRDVEKPNGILVAPGDRHVYVADSNNTADGHHQLLRFDVAADGTLKDKQVLFDFGPNRRGVDGMTLDADGNIYAAAGRGAEAGIHVFSADGKPLAFVATPGDPTNCVFGIGADAHSLYVTSATRQAEPGQQRPPYGLYRIRLPGTGHHVFPPGKP